MPETSIPPTPKHHGGGAFIGAVILMLFAMGGLLYWKFGGKDAPAVSPSAFATTTGPRFDEAPPPPPPIEPDAGKKDLPAKKRLVASSGPSPCGATCSGDVPLALRGALTAAASSVCGCYERALRQNQMLQGKVLVSVKVGQHGNACGASLVSDTLGDPSVASCVLQKFRSGTFPPPIGGCADIKVPISFMPKTAK
jgi:outer membrane biosynthesis protein TonB